MNEVLNIKKEEGIQNPSPVQKKKRGRKPKNEKAEYQINSEQTKFFVDLSKEKDSLEQIFNLLRKVNKKNYGREITFKDLALFGIDKITEKDLDKIKDGSLSEMEKVEKTLDEYNQKNGTKLSMGEFLVKKLSIN
tara:strand:+ start:285 stop:689 length:405 start_codon:yes stop_codon:yes gene_type:complete